MDIRDPPWAQANFRPPLPHSTAHQVYYTVPHQPLWNTPPPFPTILHTRCTTRYPTSLYGTPLPPFPAALHTMRTTQYSTSLYGTPLPSSPQHCTPGVLHGTPPAFMGHPSPPSPQHYTPGGLHGTPPTFMEHPSPLPHSTAHRVYYTVPHQPLWNTPPPFPTAPHTGWSTRYPTSLYGTPLPPSPQHCTAGGLLVPHQPLWNTPPPFPTALHTGCTTRYPTSLYGTPLPPSPQHCTLGGLHGTPPAFMEHSSPLPHSTAHQVVYTVPHHPLWNTPPPFPTTLHTRWSTGYPTSLYGTLLPPPPQHCTPGGLHGTPPAFMEHPSPPSPQHYTPCGPHCTPSAFMEHPSPLPHSTAHQVVYTVPHQPLWNTPPPLPHRTTHHVYYTVPHQPLWNTPPRFPTALHTTCTTRYPTSLSGTPLPPSPQHCTPGVLHGTPPAFMEHPSPLPHSTAHRVVYTVPHQPLWNIPPPFPTALHTRCTTRYPTSLYGTPLPPSPQYCTPGVLHGTAPAFMEHPSPPSPQHCTPGVLHGTPPAFMEHPPPFPHSTTHHVYYTVPHQPLWNTPPPFPTELHTRCTTWYPTSLYGTPLPPSPQHSTTCVLHSTPPAFMEHPSPLPHSTAHQVYYTVPHQPLWNTPPPFPTALHTRCTTWYPTSLYGTPLPPSPQHCTPCVLHSTPPAFMEHPSPLPHSTAHQVYYTVPHQPLWDTPPPLPHSTTHQVVYTVPHQPLWNTLPPYPTALHTGCTTRYPISLYGTPLPPSPQHCTPGGLHGTPPAFMEHPSPPPPQHCTPRVLHGTPSAFMEHPSPLPHSTAHRVVYTVPHQPLWNTPPPLPHSIAQRVVFWYPTSLYGTPLPPSPQHCTPGVLHGTPPAFMEHPSPLPHSTAHRVVYTVPHQPLWNTPPPFPTALHTRWSTRYPTSLYGTPLPPFPTELHTTCTTRYPTSLYGTPLPASPQHCTPRVLHGTPPAFMEHPSPLPHSTAHQVYYMVPHQPLWNTPPLFPTALHTGWSTRYPTSLYGTSLPPSPQHCTPGVLHGTPPAFMEHPSPLPHNTAHQVYYTVPHQPLWNTPSPLPHSTAHQVYYTVPHQPLWNTPPPSPTALHTTCTTRYPTSLYGTPLPPSPQNCTPGVLHGTPPAFMEHPSPLPHSTAHHVYYTVLHQPLWNTPPLFPTALHTMCTTQYSTSLYGTPLPSSPQHCTPGVLHGTPPAFMGHPSPPSPQHYTPGGLHGTPTAFMEHPSPLPHNTAHWVVYTVPHQPLWNTPPPFPTALHTRWSTRYPTTLYGTPLPPSPQHCTPGGLQGTPPAFMEHSSPLPHSTAHRVVYTVPHQPLWNTPPPLPHSTTHQVVHTVPHQPLWNTPPPFPTALHTRWSTRYPTSLYGTPLPPFPTELHTTCTTRYPTSLYGTPLPASPQHCTPRVLHGTPPAFLEHPSPLPHSTAHQVYYMVPHQPLWNTPPLFPTALHSGWSTRYPTSLYGTSLPPSPQHCTPGVLHGTPPAFMGHPSPLPHNTAHQVYYTVPHQPLWNTPPPLPHSTAHQVYYTVPHQPLWNTPPPSPTALHTTCTTRYPTSLYGTPLPPSPQNCTPGVLHGTPPAFMEHPSPLPHSTPLHVYYTVLHQPLWNTPPLFPTALHTRCTTRYPTSLYGTPLPPSPQHCTPGVLHGTPPAFMEHPSPLPHSTAHHVYYTVLHQPLWNTPPLFPTALHTRCTTRYPTSLYGTPLPPFPTALHTRWSTRYPTNLYGTPFPPTPQHCTPGVLHGTPSAFMEHPSPLPHSTAHRVVYMVPHQPLWNTPPPLPHSTAHHVYYTVPHQPLWNTPPPFPTAPHTGWSTRYPTSLYGTPLPPFPTALHSGWSSGTPPAFMEHPSPLPHSTAHRVYYTVPHQPLWNTPPPFPIALHTGWSTRYPTSLYGTPLPPSPQHCTPGGLHGTPPAFMEHPSPPSPQNYTPRVLHGTPPAFMEHPSPLPHSTAHHVYYTVPHQPLWNTPPPFPTALHTRCTTWYPTSLYGIPLPSSPQHCTPGGLHGTPPAFMEHPSPLPHSTAHQVYYTVPHQPLLNTPPPFPTILHTRCTTRYPTSLYGTPPPPFPTALHTRCTTRYPTSLYGTPPPLPPQHYTPRVLHGTPPAFMEHPSPLPHRTAHQVYYMVPHQPLWNTPPPFPTALHTMCTTQYSTSLYGTPLPSSPQHCTPCVPHSTPPPLWNTPPLFPTALHTRCTTAFMEHPSPLPHSTAHQVYYTVPHQPLWDTPPPLPHSTTHQVVYTVPHQPLWNTLPPYPTALHTGCTTRYPISLYGTPLPPSPQHCTPGGLHGTPPAFMEHPPPPPPQHCTPRVLHGTPSAFMEHPSPLPHSTAHRVVYTVPHQPLWNTPPPFPTALHSGWSTGTPPAFMEHPSPLPHSTAHRVYYTVPHQPLWNTPPPFPIALHTGWSTRYPTRLYATPLPPSPQHCTLGGLHGTPLAFMEHPSPLPHSTAHQVVYTVPHHPLWNTPPPFPTALHTRWSTRYPTTLYETPLPPSPQHCRPGGLHDTPPAFMEHPSPPSAQNYTPGVLHGTPPTFMEHPSPLPHNIAHYVYYTVPHQPLWNTPPPFPTSLHTGWSTWYPTSLYGTPLPPSPTELHTTCTTRYPTSLYGTPLPPFPTELHTTCTTRYPISLYGTPLPPSPQHCTPGGLHGTPPAFMEHPSPPSPQNYTPGGLHCTPSAFMEHPSPLPHSTAHRVVYTVPHQPLWNTPAPFPTALHTRWSTRYPTSLYGTPLPPFPTKLHTRRSTLYPISLYGTPLPPSPQHCTPVGLHGTPPAFMEHPSPLPHSTAHRVVYTVPHQPLWNIPTPLPHRTTHQVVYTVPHQPLWNTPPPFPRALHTTCTTRYPTSLYGTPLPHSPQRCTPGGLHGTPPAFMEHSYPPSPQNYTPGGLHGTPSAFMEHSSPLPHSTAHRVVYTVPHQPLWNTPPPLPHRTTHQVIYTVPQQPLCNTPPPFATALHTGCTTRYPTSLYGTPLPPSPHHCTPCVLHGTPLAFMEHPSPLPHSTAHQVVYTVPHQPFWNTPPPLPHSTAHHVYYTVPHQPLWNTPPPFPTALHTRWSTQSPTSLYGTPLPPSP